MQPKSLNEINADWLGERRTDSFAPVVLIADDSEADVFFLLRAFAASGLKNPVHVVRSGGEAIDYLAGAGKFADRGLYPLPKIVFVDLKMPYPDGFEVLKWKQERMPDGILWVATSNFDSVRTINAAYAAGATTFLTKPLDAADVRNLIDAFDDFWTIKGTEFTGSGRN
ncbi:MAG TPA: response regulator [Verrucomicrobiae bacterium]